jgi:hypothetical protein
MFEISNKKARIDTGLDPQFGPKCEEIGIRPIWVSQELFEKFPLLARVLSRF